MSYILDALRKSDQQRQHGQAPTLQMAEPAAATGGRQGALAYGLTALILLGSGIAIGWWQPWQAATPPTATPLPAAPLSTVPPPAPAPPLNPYPAVAETPAATAPAPAAIATDAVLAAETPAPAPAAATKRSRNSADAAKNRPPKAAAHAPAKRTRPAAGTSDQPLLTIAELPPAIRQELPPLSISVHAYSPRAAERIVGINNKLLREGGNLPPGLTLEQITPEGMIFSYKGYRFRYVLGDAAAALR
jgi:general secretion pathway protein B